MRGSGFENWVDRPGLIAAVAFLAGAAVTAVVLLVFFRLGGDDDNESPLVVATSTLLAGTPTTGVTALPGTTTTPGAPAPTATPGSYTDPDDALAAFVQGGLGQTYLGPCPESPPATEGICSVELYRSDVLLTAYVGPPLSEGLGEAVLVKNENGTWAMNFIPAPASTTLTVGGQAIVYGSEQCLNVREAPTVSSTPPLSCQIDGTRVTVSEGPVSADDLDWWRLQDLGWAAGQYLIPAGG
jgi:hypothetical protein